MPTESYELVSYWQMPFFHDKFHFSKQQVISPMTSIMIPNIGNFIQGWDPLDKCQTSQLHKQRKIQKIYINIRCYILCENRENFLSNQFKKQSRLKDWTSVEKEIPQLLYKIMYTSLQIIVHSYLSTNHNKSTYWH